MWVWIKTRLRLCCPACFLCGSCAMFTRPATTEFSKFFFKTGSNSTIHIFKIILRQCFQFSTISDIQIDTSSLGCYKYTWYTIQHNTITHNYWERGVSKSWSPPGEIAMHIQLLFARTMKKIVRELCENYVWLKKVKRKITRVKKENKLNIFVKTDVAFIAN